MFDSPASPARTAAMVAHWVSTPAWGYLGSPYGFDAPALLMRPLASGAGTVMEQKLREDVPIVGMMPAAAVQILGESTGPDNLALTLQVSAAEVQAYIDAGGSVRVSQG
ncbi:hypothetical protein [Ideonella livida]|uniref:Uncharacterized protein n=1 Tax=Ideonella livida TaxID=2707176 RepID=A0A7C9PEC8_9BURK|nr:hypothetical protein [Ideonella livida]NDY89737.1 hypothetical protein [Ideonella livida]